MRVVLDAGDSTVGQASELSRSQEGVAASGDTVADGDATFRGSRDAADAVADGLSDAPARGSSPNGASEGDRVDRGEPLASSEPVGRRPEGSSEPEGFGVAEARRRYPEVARALENAGAQAREAQLRCEAGSRDSTRQRVAGIRARLAEMRAPDRAGTPGVGAVVAMPAEKLQKWIGQGYRPTQGVEDHEVHEFPERPPPRQCLPSMVEDAMALGEPIPEEMAPVGYLGQTFKLKPKATRARTSKSADAESETK